MSPSQTATRGRPRKSETDAAIHAATRELLAEVGYADFTMAEVAKRAGVGKPTVYRRHGSKSSVVAAALVESLSLANPDLPDTGDVNRDVRKLLANLVRALTTTEFGPSMAEMIGPSARDPELGEVMSRALEYRRSVIRDLLKRAKKQGRLLTPNVETGIDTLLGAVYFRYLMSDLSLSASFVGAVVDLVIAP